VSFLAVADVAILANKVFLSLQAVNEAEDQLAVIDRLEHSYVSAAMRQLVCSYDNSSCSVPLSFSKLTSFSCIGFGVIVDLSFKSLVTVLASPTFVRVCRRDLKDY